MTNWPFLTVALDNKIINLNLLLFPNLNKRQITSWGAIALVRTGGGIQKEICIVLFDTNKTVSS